MNDRLKTIVDLENYPIHDLSSNKIQTLIKKCKDDLDQFSCSTIPNFILPKSIETMNFELEKKIDKVFMSKKSINPYLNSKDDPSLSPNHPKRTFLERNNGYLNSDLFDKDS
ncbi:hypothetical protein N9T14_01550, partial [bacterium]|nr:hypothetical protein [bacterium]